MKRIIAFVLVFCCACSLFCLSAYAKDELYWSVKNGELLVYGEGEMPDYTADVAPWREKDKKAKDVEGICIYDGVTHVGQQAFQYCSNAEEVYIADSVETIGEAAFYECKKLREVRMPGELEKLGVSAFDHCSALESMVVPEGVEVIENAAFNCCSSLEWVFIPESVTEIEDSAFNACSSLKTVYYGGSWSDWNEIEIAGYNKNLLRAEIFFDCTV